MGTGGSKDGAPQVPTDPKTSKSVIPQSSGKGSRVTEAKTAEVKLPHNYEAIIKDADSPVDNSSTKKLYNQLRGGIFLNQKKKKYWVDGKSNKNCFMLFARDLSITWGEDKRYWHWPYIQEASHGFVDVAELLRVCWLEMNGKFEMVNLSPDTVYEVVFLVMLKDSSFGWEVPVNVKLILPDGTTQQHQDEFMAKPRGSWIEIPAGEFRTSSEKIGDIQLVNLSPDTVYEVVFLVMLKDSSFGWEVPVNVKLILPDGTTQQHQDEFMAKPRGSWIEIPAGEFRTSSEKIGDIQFSLYETEGGQWKSGLIIKGVVIRPKV